jgi:hypothetical protein
MLSTDPMRPTATENPCDLDRGRSGALLWATSKFSLLNAQRVIGFITTACAAALPRHIHCSTFVGYLLN